LEETHLDHQPFVKFLPVFKPYLWGGRKLKALYGAREERVAEAWLLSAHPDGESVIAGGKYEGLTLREYLKTEEKKEGDAPFPILIKLIDAARTLSVQVHPGDAYARLHENDGGKNELWTVLESDPDAYLYVGFNRDVTREEVRRRVRDGTIEDVLNKIPTHAGDAVYIPAGTVHAIGAGNLILEVQQSSNATYRLYDYQRRGADGNFRPLHLDRALDVLRYQQYGGSNPAACPYFSVARHTVTDGLTLPMADGRFASVVCVRGEGSLRRDGKETSLRRGDSLYLPAAGGPADLEGGLEIAVTLAAR
jgi:mannose-6-phosphate isomerase